MLRLPALAAVIGLLGAVACAPPPAAGAPPLVLEQTIPLSGVSGRIDHLAIDPSGRRLFVAELGNGSVEAIDLKSGRSLGRIEGLKEPQGLGYLAPRDELVVATGGDGMLRFYRAADLKLTGVVKLGEDADDVRVSPGGGTVFVGYGRALAIVEPTTRTLTRTLALPAHPEGFQVRGNRAYVNLPDAGGVAVVDLVTGRDIARWSNPGPQMNFPMEVDREGREIAVVYRLPQRLVLFTAATGAVTRKLDTCGDADDVVFDRTDQRLYVICGGGAVDVFDSRAGYPPAIRVATRPGARTGLYSAELDRLFVAAPARRFKPAAILVFRPSVPKPRNP